MTQEQEGLNCGGVLRNLLLFHNPDAQRRVWAIPSFPKSKVSGRCRAALVVRAQ